MEYHDLSLELCHRLELHDLEWHGDEWELGRDHAAGEWQYGEACQLGVAGLSRWHWTAFE
jgi:hypothetical protein